MIRVRQYKQITVPCKNKETKQIENFTVLALDFEHAKNILFYELDLGWIVGFGAM